MKKWRKLNLFVLGMACLLPRGARAQQAEIRVDTTAAGIPTSPLLYGIFFEEINHAGDGGLYAELVRNRSFDDDKTNPVGWKLEGASEGVQMRLDTSRPLGSNNRTALMIQTPRDNGKAHVTLTNEGFWGMSFEKGTTYRLALFARSDVPLGAVLHVTLRDNKTDEILAQGTIPRIGSEWKRSTLNLKPRTSAVGHLALSWADGGTVWLDTVSLFPQQTFAHRKNGLRRDLGEKVKAMHPAFVRFPGGCFVEGNQIANAFRWKETLGEIHTRPGHLNDVWNYRSTDGLGYHEYLQMCEDWGAEPLFVVNCGMAHLDKIPMNEIDAWVQNALDAVEYANGSVTTKWGAERAKNGHSKPFGLKYLEIGNENGWGNTLPAYEERYARFYDALRKTYPKVKLIANVPVSNRNADILDDHFYQSPDWFVANAGMYESATEPPRKSMSANMP